MRGSKEGMMAPSLEQHERMGQEEEEKNAKEEEEEWCAAARTDNSTSGTLSITVKSSEDLTTSLLCYRSVHVTNLKVNLSLCKLGSTEIQKILKAFPALAELSLDGLEIDSHAFRGGISGLKVIRIRMERMSLLSSSLSAFSVQAPNILLLSLASNALEELELSFLGNKRMLFLQSFHLSTFLTKSPYLRTLTLGNLYGMSSNGGTERASTPPPNNTLRYLRLEHCILESQFLRELLHPSHELEDVSLSKCILHPGAVTELQAATHRRWKYCRLDHIKLGLQAPPEAMNVFLRDAFRGGTLRCLSLQQSSESQIQALTLHQLLARNPNLAHLSGFPLDSTALLRMGLNSVAFYDASPSRFHEDDTAWMTAVTRLADPQQQSLSSLHVFLREYPMVRS